MESWNWFFDKTELSLRPTRVSCSEIPLHNFYCLKCRLPPRKDRIIAAVTQFQAESYVCCRECELCVLRRSMSFHSK